MTSEASARAEGFIAAHRDAARALGERLVELIDEPEVFVRALGDGLSGLQDPAFTQMAARVSPGVPAGLTIRAPLVEAIQRPLRRGLAEGSPSSALWLAQRLADADDRQVRLFALPCLERSLPPDPERSWQLMRRLGRSAGDWIEVDTLAGLWAQGVLAEPFRWAELEQLVYSRSGMERRLVGAVLATIPHRVGRDGYEQLARSARESVERLIRWLMGDAEDTVQKGLSWAIREWTVVHPTTMAALLRDETAIAVEQADGHRAWVIRDALAAQPEGLARSLRERLSGIRRDPDAPSTSNAARQAAQFASLMARADDAVGEQGQRFTRSFA